MKRSLLSIITLLCLIPALWCAPKRMMVDKIEPPYWWTSMANDTLQLMVYGQGIRDAEVTLDYPGVSIQSVERPEGLNYLFLYLTVSDQAKPGDLKLRFSVGKKKQIVTYHLLARDKSGDKYEGFDASDVLYLIMPDRFADGDTTNNNLPGRLKNPVTVDRANPNARHGGDIRGMINHLDYIDSLGVTAVWVNPVFTNDMPGGSYHGYATTDYYSIDPRFGSNKEWNEFVRNCQQRGIKVVMDMIYNHVGSAHPWFTDRPTSDWFNFPEGYQQTNYRLSTLHDPYVSDYDLAHTVDGWFVKEMPDLNQRNPHQLKYLIQNSIWWIESSKINGIRMDTYPYADLKAMARWIDEVEKEYPNFNIVGECWYNNEGSEAFWQRGSKVNPVDPRLETVMDFKIAIDGRKYFMEQTDPWNGLNHLYDHLALDYLFPNPQKILTFLDNHDTDRFLPAIPDSLDQWKQAQTFLLTSRGIPQIYYGTELLMNGAREGSDGYVRRDVPGGFPGDIVDQFTQAGRTPMQNDAYDFMSKLLHWRRGEANEVIARGSLKHFMPQNGVYVYRRKLGDKEIHVLMNGNDAPLHITMERTLETLPYGSQWTDVMSGQKVTIEPEMDFAPRQIMILQNF